jgi:hypothetical protein
MLPGLILFDFLPRALGKRGLTEWYCRRYREEAEKLIPLVYIPFTVLLIMLYLINT